LHYQKFYLLFYKTKSFKSWIGENLLKTGIICSLIFKSKIIWGQSITGIIIPGATTSNSGSTWDVTFYSSTTTNTAKDNYKEIKLIQNNTKGEYIVFDAVSGASDWEIVQGQPGSGS